MAPPRRRHHAGLALASAAVLSLALPLRLAFAGARVLAQEPGRSPPRLQLRAVQNEVSTADPAQLEFETYKFNLAWTKMKQAEENKSPDLPELKKEVEDLAKMVESLGGSKPAEMMTLDEAEKRVKAVREDLNFEKLWNMSFEERWLLAQGLGPAFPISLILSYTIYWTANVPFIAYAYYTTVLTGTATMGLVMAGAYTASIPFKPLIYIGGILLTPWVADNVMPLIGKALNMFRLPDEEELNKGLGV